MPSSTAQACAQTGLPVQYPTALIDTWWLGGTQRLLLRPVLPQDERLLSDLVLAQSADARRSRFHSALRPSPQMCRQMSQVDYRQQLALVVSTLTGGVEQLVADARYCVTGDGRAAEIALMVDERWQRRGVGGWALLVLQQAAAHAGLARLEGDVLLDNRSMLGLAHRCGFVPVPGSQDGRLVRMRHRLAAADASAACAPSAHRKPGFLQRLRRTLADAAPTIRRGLLAH